VTSPEAQCLADFGNCIWRYQGIREDAVEEMTSENGESGRFEARARGQELRKDIFASAALFQHLAKAANLAFDPAEAVE